jgi:predicted nucleic acid-binding protein
MSTYVIDASVAVKWVIAEPFHVEAKRFVNPSFILLVTGHFLLECASAIQKKVWRKEIHQDDGWHAYEILRDYERLFFVSTYDLLPKAYVIASQYWHSIHDCISLALALQKDAIVVTADRKFYDQIHDTDLANLIAWVEDPPVLAE